MANNIPAVFGVNKFLWNYLGDDGAAVLRANDYQGLIPIIPSGEAPQFLQMLDEQPGIQSHPYIVYTWYTNGFDANSWFRPTDTVVYTIYALDQSKINEIVMYIVNLFKRFDVSAAEVNRFIQTNDFGPMTQLYRDYSYGYISVAAATGGVAPSMENDPITATITLRVNYTNPVVDTPLS